ncbi:MAG: hypothetical protein RL701_1266 [Pseudomonadota bacterium]
MGSTARFSLELRAFVAVAALLRGALVVLVVARLLAARVPAVVLRWFAMRAAKARLVPKCRGSNRAATATPPRTLETRTIALLLSAAARAADSFPRDRPATLAKLRCGHLALLTRMPRVRANTWPSATRTSAYLVRELGQIVMPSIGNVLIAARVLSYVLDKYFNAKGADMRAKVKSASDELGPDLTRDLTQIASVEERASHSAKAAASELSDDVDQAVQRAWRGLRKRKPEAAADELEAPPPTEESAGGGWILTALIMFLFLLAMSSVNR